MGGLYYSPSSAILRAAGAVLMILDVKSDLVGEHVLGKIHGTSTKALTHLFQVPVVSV